MSRRPLICPLEAYNAGTASWLEVITIRESPVDRDLGQECSQDLRPVWPAWAKTSRYFGSEFRICGVAKIISHRPGRGFKPQSCLRSYLVRLSMCVKQLRVMEDVTCLESYMKRPALCGFFDGHTVLCLECRSLSFQKGGCTVVVACQVRETSALILLRLDRNE